MPSVTHGVQVAGPNLSGLGRLHSFTRRHPNGRNRALLRRRWLVASSRDELPRQHSAETLRHPHPLLQQFEARGRIESDRLQCGNRFAAPATTKANEAFALLVEVDAVFVREQ